MGKIVLYSSCTSSFTGNRCETFIDSPTVSTTQMITSSTTAAATFSTANPTQSSTQAPTQAPTQFSTQSTSTVSTQSPIQSTTQQTSQQTTQSQTQATTQVSTQAPQLDLCKFYADRNMNICQNNGQCVFISDGAQLKSLKSITERNTGTLKVTEQNDALCCGASKPGPTEARDRQTENLSLSASLKVEVPNVGSNPPSL